MLVMENLEGDAALIGCNELFHLLHAVVGTTIIYNNALDVGVCLHGHRLQAFLHVVGDVIDGNNDGNQMLSHTATYGFPIQVFPPGEKGKTAYWGRIGRWLRPWEWCSRGSRRPFP